MYKVARVAQYKSDEQAYQFADFASAMEQAEAFQAQGATRVLVLEPAANGSEILAIL
jgi:hypothetical protein